MNLNERKKTVLDVIFLSSRPGEWSNCEYYKLNYADFEKMSYQQAMENVRSSNKLDLLECNEYSYELEGIGTSIVPEVRLYLSNY